MLSHGTLPTLLPNVLTSNCFCRQAGPEAAPRPSEAQPCSPASGVRALPNCSPVPGEPGPGGAQWVPGAWGQGLTYQTLAGTLSCDVTGNGTWKTLREKKTQRTSEETVQEVNPNHVLLFWWAHPGGQQSRGSPPSSGAGSAGAGAGGRSLRPPVPCSTAAAQVCKEAARATPGGPAPPRVAACDVPHLGGDGDACPEHARVCPWRLRASPEPSQVSITPGTSRRLHVLPVFGFSQLPQRCPVTGVCSWFRMQSVATLCLGVPLTYVIVR